MSVQVQYTIPGWQPTHIEQQIAPEGSPFRTHMEAVATPAMSSVPALLGLNHPPPGELHLEPPPRPAGVPYTDASEDRRQWHGLISRHGDSASADPKTAGMMTVLNRLQDLHDQAAIKMMQGASR
jgi:hypothetical protein